MTTITMPRRVRTLNALLKRVLQENVILRREQYLTPKPQ